MQRVLGLVTELRREEVVTALLMTLNGFFLLMAYSCIKPVREALILSHPGGAEYKVYMGGATAILLLGAVPAYAFVAARLPRNRLIVGVTLFFGTHLLAFYALGISVGPTLPLALAFYLWIAIFNMMIVAQFWAFANDLYTEEAGKRVFPLIGLGASLGAVAGAGAAAVLIDRVGSLEMMLLAAAILVGSAGVTEWVHVREVGRAGSARARHEATQAVGGNAGDAFRTVLAQRYLLLIAVFSLVFTLVKTNGDYVLARIVEDTASEAVAAGALTARGVPDYIGRFFADLSFWIDVISLGLQAFVVSRVVKYFGLGIAFLMLPVVALADAATMAVLPILVAVRIGKTAESAIDYSMNNTVRNMLWLPTSRRAKYLAKQAIDTFFVRAGDVSSAGLVFVGVQLGLHARAFALVNVVLVAGWLLLARAIIRENARLTANAAPEA
ncbi:MAG TPA: Npt1/Npt2 family nucleotide transporter [Vicinamibacterales bacterium]|nr:Npt1/Npt2 family nucleotide transporter [Vicinamibacterales bacterium]